MQPIEMILVPYDSGRRGERMGAGPLAFVERGLADVLRHWKHDVAIRWIEADAADPLHSAVTLALQVAAVVAEARRAERFPLVLAGNCITTVGAVAGLRRPAAGSTAADATGVVWLDAHGDLNTPVTSTSGFLDGMAAAVLLGWCHADEFAAVDGYVPLAAERFLLVGARDLDAGEADSIAERRIEVLPPRDAQDEDVARRTFDSFGARSAEAWLHVDLDVLDPAGVARANDFAAPDGLSLYTAIRIVQHLVERCPLAGMTLSAWDPAVDADGLVFAAAVPLVSEALTAQR